MFPRLASRGPIEAIKRAEIRTHEVVSAAREPRPH